MLQRLTYVSKAAAAFDVDAVVDAAAKSNMARGITGVLFAGEQTFLQVLEGPRDAVSALFLKIANDVRHTDIILVEALSIEGACYPDWGMNIVADANKTRALWTTSDMGDFEPHKMTARAITDFVRAATFELMSQQTR